MLALSDFTRFCRFLEIRANFQKISGISVSELHPRTPPCGRSRRMRISQNFVKFAGISRILHSGVFTVRGGYAVENSEIPNREIPQQFSKFLKNLHFRAPPTGGDTLSKTQNGEFLQSVAIFRRRAGPEFSYLYS